jgi:hypothetical protein
MPAKKKNTPIPESIETNVPVEPASEPTIAEPALTADTISQVVGRGAAQPVPQPVVTPPPPQPPVAAPLVFPQAPNFPPDQGWMYDAHLNDNMPAAEETTITLLRTTTYQMPGTCPVCNEQRLGGTGKIHTSNSYKSGNMKYTLSLDFPLCKKCTDIQALFSKINGKAGGLGAIPGVLAGIGIAILGSSGTSSSSNSGNFFCYGIIAGAIVWGIAGWIISSILTRNMPKTLKERNKRIAGAASISGFNPTHVNFKFNNKSYAAAFQLLNSMGGANLIQQLLETMNKKQST